MVCTPRMRTQEQEKDLDEAQRDDTTQVASNNTSRNLTDAEERERYEALVMSSRIVLVFGGSGCTRYLDGLDDSIPRESIVRMPRIRAQEQEERVAETQPDKTVQTAALDACRKFPAAEVQDKDAALVKASRMIGETRIGCKI